MIIPTYRRRQYLTGAVRSALAQTYGDLEVIVTDNDNEGGLPRELSDPTDPRLRYRRNPTNLGMLGNLRAAVREARGPYLAALHDDDLWEPRLLEKLVPHLDEDPTLAVAFADHHAIDQDGQIDKAKGDAFARTSGRDRLAPGRHVDIAKMALLDGSIPIVVAALLRRSGIDWSSFPEEVSSAYDLWLCYLVFRSGGGAYYHPERLARYRTHAGGETQGNRISHEQAAAYCYEQFIRDTRLESLRPELKREYANHQFSAATALLRVGRSGEAKSRLASAMRLKLSPRIIFALMVSMLPVAMAQKLTVALVALRRKVARVID